MLAFERMCLKKVGVAACLLLVSSVALLAPSSAAALPKARLIQPCRTEARTLPVKVECVAAAMAEQAFLKETHNRIRTYLISPMRHTDTEWFFMILLGDKDHPPADGGHYMIAVSRQTGATQITPGR